MHSNWGAEAASGKLGSGGGGGDGGGGGGAPAGSAGGVKKFTLKPMSKPVGMDVSRASETVMKVLNAVADITQSNCSHLSFEELYRYSYNLVLHKHGEMLYTGVSNTIAAHLQAERDRVRTTADSSLLATLRTLYERHAINMRMIKDILMYMDRTFVPQFRKMLVYDHGISLFRDTVVKHADVKPRVQALLLEAVRDARAGASLDAPLVRSVLAMLVDLGIGSVAVYQELFEAPLLAETQSMYHTESGEMIERSPTSEYLVYAERRLDEERERAQAVMHVSSLPKIVATVERKLVADHALALMEKEGSGLLFQLQHDRIDDLNRMYRLFSHVKMALTWRPPPELVSSERDRERNAIPVVILRDMMKAKVVREGSSIVSDPELLKEPSRVIASLLDLRDKYVAIVERAFCGDRIFATGLKEAFEMIVNRGDDGRGSNGVPEFLATYVDEAMTRDFKTLTEMEVSERLDKVVHLFRFLHSKDVFEEHYKDKTARRLLGGKITSEDTERLMISKLKQECGSNYTNKLEGMFADLHRSATFMEQFRRDQGAAVAALGLELDATVLTSSNWVGRQLQSVPMPKGLPPSVEAAAGIFHKYYLSKHNGRRLVWNCSKGTVEIRARFGAALTTAGAKPYELTVSTYQMIVLMALNDRPSLPYRDLAALCIPEDELKRHLLSLTNAKIRILNKSTASKDITDADVFTVNDAFASKLLRIKVPLVSMRSAQAAARAGAGGSGAAGGAGAGAGAGAAAGEEGGEVAAAVEEGRKLMLESVIVRIMKTRKHMEHNALVAEVTRMVSARFVPQPHEIKKRIEHLIERDYIERSTEDHSVYAYLA